MMTNIGLYVIICNTYRFLIDNNYKILWIYTSLKVVYCVVTKQLAKKTSFVSASFSEIETFNICAL
jgi:hypothetical protein